MFWSKIEREAYIRSIGGKKNKSDWFRKDGTTTTATVPTTPDGLLAKQMTASLAACPAPGKCKTKVIEGGGQTVKQNLMRGNPFPRQSCGREDCIVDQCSEGGCKEKCYLEGVGYCGTCRRCTQSQMEEGRPPESITNYSYTGESARSVYTRAKQHLENYRSHLPGRKSVESWMWNHTVSHHAGVMGPGQGAGDYTFRLQGHFCKPLQRQVDEAVRLGQIEQHGLVLDEVGSQYGGPVQSLNSRGEYYHPRIVQYSFDN